MGLLVCDVWVGIGKNVDLAEFEIEQGALRENVSDMADPLVKKKRNKGEINTGQNQKLENYTI